MEVFPDQKACADVLRDTRRHRTQIMKDQLTKVRWWNKVNADKKQLAYGTIHFIKTERKFKAPEEENDSPDLSEEDILETTKMGKKFADNLAGKMIKKIALEDPTQKRKDRAENQKAREEGGFEFWTLKAVGWQEMEKAKAEKAKFKNAMASLQTLILKKRKESERDQRK